MKKWQKEERIELIKMRIRSFKLEIRNRKEIERRKYNGKLCNNFEASSQVVN